MRIRQFSKHSFVLFIFFVGWFSCLPYEGIAQRRNPCHTCSDNQSNLPESSRILKANARRGGRVPLHTKRQERVQNRKPILPFIMNEPSGPLKPSDRDRFYGIGALEMGFNAGTSHVYSDITGKFGTETPPAFQKLFLHNFSPALGIFGRYRINEWVGFSFGADFSVLEGSNQDGYIYRYPVSVDVSGITTMNETAIHSFSNDLVELSGKMELYSPPIGRSSVSFYAFAGFAAYRQNPRIYNAAGDVVSIPTLRIENENPSNPGVPFVTWAEAPSRQGFSLPFGGGMTVMLANFFRVGLEVGYRHTGSHGLDGAFVPDNAYDAYMFNTIRIGYVFPMLK